MNNQGKNVADDDFESVKGTGTMWNPTKDEDGDPRTEATADDFITGYFVDTKYGVGQHGATVYTLEKKDGERIQVWGTTALNGEMEKVRLGQFIKIQWLGKMPTKAGALKPEKKRVSTDSFHAWDVLISKSTPAKDIATSINRPASTPAASNNVSAGKASTVASKKAEDDESDLPF